MSVLLGRVIDLVGSCIVKGESGLDDGISVREFALREGEVDEPRQGHDHPGGE